MYVVTSANGQSIHMQVGARVRIRAVSMIQVKSIVQMPTPGLQYVLQSQHGNASVVVNSLWRIRRIKAIDTHVRDVHLGSNSRDVRLYTYMPYTPPHIHLGSNARDVRVMIEVSVWPQEHCEW